MRIVQRLLLGAFLIAAVSSVLLFSDLERRAARTSPAAGKRWNIHLLEYVEIEDGRAAREGLLEVLEAEAPIAGIEFDLTPGTAHGDMATLSGLVDAAVTDQADLLVTLSTPTLQAALNRGRGLPTVFSLVANPLVAGAGETDDEHLPNVTGVYAHGAYEEVVAAVKECLPQARTVGTLFVPAEVNTVFHKDRLTEVAAENGIEVVAMAVTSPTEIADAASALCSRDIDAVTQVGGNLLSSAFVSIAAAARSAGLPSFAFLSGQAEQGAVVTIAKDYEDGGRQSARLALRVMQGEDPEGIPFEPIRSTKIILNLPAAQAVGLVIPAALMDRADRLIR